MHVNTVSYMAESQGSKSATYLDLKELTWPGAGLDGLNVNEERGICMSILPRLLVSPCLTFKALAITPTPVSTRAWPRDPALEPRSGISLRAWKFRGLRPRTTIGAVVDSDKTTLLPSDKVPNTLRCNTKCCCSSLRLPLFAVALGSIRLSAGTARCSGRKAYIRNCRRRHPIGYTAYSPLASALLSWKGINGSEGGS